jgi:cell division protein FtsX
MSSLEIKDQHRLPLGRCAELVLNGIQYRLFRAAVTVVIIALAVAFLMTMLSESLTARRVAQAIEDQTAPRDAMLFWTSRVSIPLTEQQLTAALADAKPEGPRWQEFARWGNLNQEQMTELTRVARMQAGPDPETDGIDVGYQVWFDDLTIGQSRPLVGRAKGTEIFRELQDDEAMEQFRKELPNIGQPLPGDVETFEQFLADWQQTADERQAILDGNREAVEQFRKLTDRRSAEQIFSQADEQDLEHLRQLGYRFSPEEIAVIREQARLAIRFNQLKQVLGIQQVKRSLARERANNKLTMADTPLFFDQLASNPEWLINEMNSNVVIEQADQQEIRLPTDMSADEIRSVASAWLDQEKLSRVEASVGPVESGGFMGFTGRTMWLIVVSFVVCVVGIANAMLMSVTERFREIATMKCLGATDGFIMINFILESCLQGTAGGIIGALLGLILGILRAGWSYGQIALLNLPWVEMLWAGLLSMGVGIVLSAMAAVYPAWIAARLAPMEAMRIE